MPALFLIHGMWSTPRAWDEYQAYFQNLGYRTFAPALPQHFTNNSAENMQGLSLKHYLEQLERDYLACEQACGDKPIIIGHSMGGLLAQQLAARVVPPALVLLAPAPHAGMFSLDPSPLRTMCSPLMTPLFWRRGVKLDEKGARYGLYNCLPKAEQDKQLARLCYESGQVIREIALWFSDRKGAAKVAPHKVSCPVLTLAGKEDRITPASACRKISEMYMGNSHFHELSRHGHMLNCEPGWEAIAQQIHVWLCWQLGSQQAS